MSNAAIEGNTATVTNLRSRADRLRAARAALAEEIGRRFPDYADLVRPEPAQLAATAALLHPDEALITTYVGQVRTFVWAIRPGAPPTFTAAPIGIDAMHEQVTRLRAVLAPNATTLARIRFNPGRILRQRRSSRIRWA